MKTLSVLVYSAWFLLPTNLWANATLLVDTQQTLKNLLQEADRNQDKKITLTDKPRTFTLKGLNGENWEIKGHYFLANLLQELKLAEANQQNKSELYKARIFEEPGERTSRLIRELYWDGLTRRLDLNNLNAVMLDTKLSNTPGQFLYVPSSDKQALTYFSKSSLKIQKVPKVISQEYLKSLAGKHGPLTLALQNNAQGQLQGVPFVVPGGRFNEMYGWDSYFESIGLIIDGRVDLAKAMVDNFVYQINHYGKILNANRSYYLSRSQPPFFTSMIKSVYTALPKTKENKIWFKSAVQAAIKEYTTVWLGKDRLTPIGLSRYYGINVGVPPEVEPGHYNAIFATYAQKHKLPTSEFETRYRDGKISEPELDDFFTHDQAVRESGHDTSYRWRIDGKDQCANFVTVDLNSLLYKYEIDLADIFANELQDKKQSSIWSHRSAKRKALILTYLWDPEREMFFDYDFVHKKRHEYVSATAFYPLWAWDPERPETQLVPTKTALKSVQKMLAQLEVAGGIAATSEASLKKFGDLEHARQWDFPNGWAPHQMMAWKALENYGLTADRNRLINKWLLMITDNARDFNGTIPEKFDVVKRSHLVFAEYGNVGTDFSYITREGFGWMNASYQLGRKILSLSK